MDNPEIWRRVITQSCRTLLNQDLNVPNFAAHFKNEGVITEEKYQLILSKETADEKLIELLDIVVARDRFWEPILHFLQDSPQAGIKKQLEDEYRRLKDEAGGHVEGTKTRKSWQKLKFLGRGAFGNVYLVSRTGTDVLFALKLVEFNPENPTHMKEVKSFENEITQLSSLDYPRIVKYFGSERDERSICIFMEYMPGGSLQDEIKSNGPLKEVRARKFIRQLLEGLSYLHASNKIHRDIKNGNILLDVAKENVKIADFGTCKQLPNLCSRDAKTYIGSTYFMAPEIIRGENYGRKADMWSLGCTIVEMLTGSPPWKDFEPAAATFRIGSSETKPTYTLPDEISSALGEFLDILFMRDPNDRPSPEDALRQFDLSFTLENPNIWRQVISQRGRTLLDQNLNVHNFAEHLRLQRLISQVEYQLILNNVNNDKRLIDLLDIVLSKDRFWDPLLQFLEASLQSEVREQLEEEYRKLNDEREGYDEALPEGWIQVQEVAYNPQEILGEGSDLTIVFKGRFDRRDVAVKRVRGDFIHLNRELDILLISDHHPHPNVIRYYTMEKDREYRYIALELCRETLGRYMETNDLQYDHLVQLLKHTAAGLFHLHGLSIVHRDIRPQNVLIAEDLHGQIRAVITDFGLSKNLDVGGNSMTSRSGIAGTTGWTAPELFQSPKVTYKADIFSLGCVFHFFLTKGGHPFDDPSAAASPFPAFQRQANIMTGRFSLEKLHSDAENLLAEQLIENMINQCPEQRLSAEDVLKHPFFVSTEDQFSSAQKSYEKHEKVYEEPTTEKNNLLHVPEHAKGATHQVNPPPLLLRSPTFNNSVSPPPLPLESSTSSEQFSSAHEISNPLNDVKNKQEAWKQLPSENLETVTSMKPTERTESPASLVLGLVSRFEGEGQPTVQEPTNNQPKIQTQKDPNKTTVKETVSQELSGNHTQEASGKPREEEDDLPQLRKHAMVSNTTHKVSATPQPLTPPTSNTMNNQHLETEAEPEKDPTNTVKNEIFDRQEEPSGERKGQSTTRDLRRRGISKYRLNDLQGSLADLDISLSLEPNNACALRIRGAIKRMLKDYRGSLADLNESLRLEPNNVDALSFRGATKNILKDYQGSLADLDESLLLKPNNAWALHVRGATRRMLKDYKGSLADLNKSLSLEPKNAFPLRQRGETKRKLGDYEGSLADLDDSLRLEPNNADALSFRGATKRMLKDYQGSLADLDESLSLEPNDAWILRQRGATKRTLDDFEGSLADIEESLRLEPSNEWALNMRRETIRLLENS